MRTIGVIGLGNMASAIVKGMVNAGFVSSDQVVASARNQEKLIDYSLELGVRAASSNEEVIHMADTVIIAIKPGMFATVLPPLKEAFQIKRPLVISVAAGVTLERMESLLGTGIPVVRAMPNVNAQVGESMTGLCGNAEAGAGQRADVEAMFNTFGRTAWLDESMFGIFSAVAGASPAFTFMFIEGLAKGGLKAGMAKKDAVRAAAQAVLGSALLVLESGEAPLKLVDTVCSPGGTTIAGVGSLEESAFVAAVMRAVEATNRRDKEVSAAS